MCEINNLSAVVRGFYIKNLETGITTFYPIIGTGFMYSVVNWVDFEQLNASWGIFD